MQENKWDQRFIRVAREVSSWSKDPSKQIGAVIVKDKRILATGYNGFPRGIDDADYRYNNRELKYELIVHAEMNAIYNATYNGVSLDGATMYVSGLPCCNRCALGLIQTGIKRVVMQGNPDDPRWADSWKMSMDLFNETNIEWEFI